MSTIISGSDFDPQYFSGPIIRNDYLYALLQYSYSTGWDSGSYGYRVVRGWYDESYWPAIDQDNAPTFSRIEDAVYDDRYFYIVTANFGSVDYLRFQKFDTETETWVLKDVEIASTSTSFPIASSSDNSYAQIAVDSNGKLYVCYNYYSSKGYHRARWAYSNNSGSTWTSDQTIPTGVGTKVAEYSFNVHAHGTNIYFWYHWNDGTYTKRCRVYNGTDWSNESSVVFSGDKWCKGRACHWTTSGSEIITQLFKANWVIGTYSVDTTTGSQPNWGNTLTVTTVSNTNDRAHSKGLYNGSPIHLFPYDWNAPFDLPVPDVYAIRRTSYSAWGSPFVLHDTPYTGWYFPMINPADNNDFVYLWMAADIDYQHHGTMLDWYDSPPPGATKGGYYFMY